MDVQVSLDDLYAMIGRLTVEATALKRDLQRAHDERRSSLPGYSPDLPEGVSAPIPVAEEIAKRKAEMEARMREQAQHDDEGGVA